MTFNFIERLCYRSESRLRQSLCAMTGLWPHDLHPYRLALRHRSGTRNEGNNERLEFLGDAIISAVVADVVYQHFQGGQEGMLTQMRSRIVSRESLNRISHEIGLEHLMTGVQPEQVDGTNVGGNALEALVGAVYLDRGYTGCQHFIRGRLLHHFVSLEKIAQEDRNYKSRLQEFCQKRRLKLEYQVEETRGHAGQQCFRATVFVNAQERGTGMGQNKKNATQDAARKALEYYRRRHKKPQEDKKTK